MPSGVSTNDFTFILNDWGVSVTHTPRTTALDPITGDETFTNGTPATITAICLPVNKKWMFDKDGEIEGGHAYVMVPNTVTLSKNDLITYDGKVYQVNDVIVRKLPDGTTMYSYGNLFVYTG